MHYANATIHKFTKGCDKNCAIQQTRSYTTLIGWTPTYDKWGTVTTKDPNTTTSEYKCLTCGKTWKHRFGGLMNEDTVEEY